VAAFGGPWRTWSCLRLDEMRDAGMAKSSAWSAEILRGSTDEVMHGKAVDAIHTKRHANNFAAAATTSSCGTSRRC
jgi:hypothetical protein